MVSELYLKYMKGRKKKISRGNGKGREDWEGGENKGGKARAELGRKEAWMGAWGGEVDTGMPGTHPG